MRNFVIVFILLTFIFCITPVSALVFRSNDEGSNVSDEEIINDDVFIFGDNITVNGTVNGDLVTFGSNITIDGVVNGTIVAGGSDIKINAVGVRSIWAGGGSVNIGANVQNNVVIAGRTLSVTENAVIGKELKGFGGSLDVRGDVNGSIHAGCGTFVFSGTSDDLTVNADDIRITDRAHIYGDLTVTSEKPADIEPNAIITGEIIFKKTDVSEEETKGFLALAPVLAFFITLWKIICFLAKLVVGIVIIAVSQRFVRRVMDSLTKKPWISLLVGFLNLVILPIIIVILFMLVIGFPFGIFGSFFYMVVWYLSAVFVSCVVGEKVIQLFKKEGTISLYPSFILGFVLITVLGLIPIIGFVLKLAVLLFGMGMILIGIWSLMKDMREKELL